MSKMLLFALMFVSSAALASADVGQPAPDFSLKGNDGKIHRLSDATKNHKIIVLEWFNEGCPYVHKHYDSGNMQRLQKKMTAKGDVEWFTMASSAEGRQGYISTVKQAAKMRKAKKMQNTALLMDPGSKVARAYGAKTTPHMFVIDKNGLVSYNGAIDSEDTARPMRVEEYVKNASIHKYVEDAVAALEAGRQPAVTSHDPYGCSLKY